MWSWALRLSQLRHKTSASDPPRALAVVVAGPWFLKFSQKSSLEDLSRLYGTIYAASLAFTWIARDPRGRFSADITFKPQTYLVSVHVGHVFELWNPNSVLPWKAPHDKNPQVSTFTGKKKIDK